MTLDEKVEAIRALIIGGLGNRATSQVITTGKEIKQLGLNTEEFTSVICPILEEKGWLIRFDNKLFDTEEHFEDMDYRSFPELRDNGGMPDRKFYSTPVSYAKRQKEINAYIEQYRADHENQTKFILLAQNKLGSPVKPRVKFKDLKEDEILFDYNQNAIVVRDILCPIPGGIRTAICKKIFDQKLGFKFTTLQLDEAADLVSDRASQSPRRVYDAVRAINKTVEEVCGITEFIVNENEKYWVRQDIFS